MHLTYTDNNTGKEKVVFVESDELEEASDKDLDIKSIKDLIKNPSPKMIKQYGGKDKYIKMLKSKLTKLESTNL
jgi:DnaJ-domain-containing protein 1